MEFSTGQHPQNFVTLESCLAAAAVVSPEGADDEVRRFMRCFVDCYADTTVYLAQKAFFENTATFTKVVELLATATPPLLVDVLRLVMIYCRAEVNHRYVPKTNAISLVMKAMRGYPKDLDVLEQGCRAFINIGSNDKNRKAIGKEGAVSVVLECLSSDLASATLLTAACWCIRNISVEDGNKRLISQLGGVELVSKAMRAHPTSLPLQTQGCWAIENISLKEEYRDYVTSAGAIPPVLNAMRTFPSEKKLQEACCWALANLAPNAKARDTIRKESGIELLMAASKNHPDHEPIQKHVVEAISAMSDGGATESEDEDMPPPLAVTPTSPQASPPPAPPLPPVYVPEKTPGNLTVLRKGFMTKQGGRIKTWKKRWFVLDSSKLTYYKGNDEQHPLGTVNLQICEGVLEDPDRKNCFMVVTQPRTYKILAPSRQEMVEWMGSVRSVIYELSASNRPRSIDGAQFMKQEDRERLKHAPDHETRKDDRVVSSSSSRSSDSSKVAEFASKMPTSDPPKAPTADSQKPLASQLPRSPSEPLRLPTVQMPRSPSEPNKLSDVRKADPPRASEGAPVGKPNPELFSSLEERTPSHEIEAVTLDASFSAIEKSPLKPRVDAFSNPEVLSAVIARRMVEEITSKRLEESYTKNMRGEKTEFVDALKLERIALEIVDRSVDAVLSDAALLDHLRKVPQTYLAQAWAEKGMRKTMEDRHVCYPHLNELMGESKMDHAYSVFGIFDGHGGSRAADYLGVHLHRNIAAQIIEQQRRQLLLQQGWSDSEGETPGDEVPEGEPASPKSPISPSTASSLSSSPSPSSSSEDEGETPDAEAVVQAKERSRKERAARKAKAREKGKARAEMLRPVRNDPFATLLKRAFLKTNDNFFEHLTRQGLSDPCGSTAVVVMRRDTDLYICWVGDSEASLYLKDGEDIVLCKPHKSSSQTERERVEKLGGYIQEVNGVPRLNGVLAVTRSFGDARFKKFVVPEPEIIKHTLTGQEDFLVLACDGLWDVMKPKDAGDFVRSYRDQKGTTRGVSQALALDALERKSSDNVSVVVVFFSEGTEQS